MTLIPNTQLQGLAEAHQKAQEELEVLRNLLGQIYVGPMAYLGDKLDNSKETKAQITKLLDNILDAAEGRWQKVTDILPFHPEVVLVTEKTSPEVAKIAAKYLGKNPEELSEMGVPAELREDLLSLAGSALTQAANKPKKRTKKT